MGFFSNIKRYAKRAVSKEEFLDDSEELEYVEENQDKLEEYVTNLRKSLETNYCSEQSAPLYSPNEN